MSDDSPSLRLDPIGYVVSSLRNTADAPKQADEGAPAAWLEFRADVAAGLRDLRPGDAILLFTWLHQADRSVLEVHPRDDLSRARRGVFSTRSADRPNPIGLHHVVIQAIESACRMRVDALEALDGTPILDIKPTLPARPER